MQLANSGHYMTHDEFVSFVNRPDTLTVEQMVDLKQMVDRYPYFTPARLLLLKVSQLLQDVHVDSDARNASMYVADRRWLYYYLYPEQKLSQAPIPREAGRKSTGDYFDLMSAVEADGSESKHLLTDLVTKLKSARMMMSDDQPLSPIKEKTKSQVSLKPIVQNSEDALNESLEQQEFESITLQIKKLMAEQRYQEAIDILEAYNLNNPKKSVYFADQIRFLKKVLAISK
jgi:hypothetical protein